MFDFKVLAHVSNQLSHPSAAVYKCKSSLLGFKIIHHKIRLLLNEIPID